MDKKGDKMKPEEIQEIREWVEELRTREPIKWRHPTVTMIEELLSHIAEQDKEIERLKSRPAPMGGASYL